MHDVNYKYINLINSPRDLKRLSAEQLKEYCGELRQFIIEQLSSNPGHLASNLGVVELTTALHYVYNTPDDKLIWDVGHQAYAHKIITGRRDNFHTNRKIGGLSGFPKVSESEYDAFGAGHASVSISAALGVAAANKIKGEQREVVAIIGDGALSGGLAFEGLNNAGASNTNLLVILNDNHMSIDQNVGALKEYLLSISTSQRYNKLKTKMWNALQCTPRLRRVLQNTGNAIKQGLLQQSNLFESLNFRYFGPVDGHDVEALTKVLNDLKGIPGPKLLHVLTVKGKGYKPAEQDQSTWHAPGMFDPKTGELLTRVRADAPKRYQDVFGQTLLELARINPNIVGITPAMPTGCSMNIMMEQMPEKCFDVGIAEGHAVTFSAGLATQGLVPFCNIYSSFMQRAYDNVIHDVALQKLGVVLCLDRAGLVGEDGPTHHGVFDIAYFRPIPNLVISSPMNEVELRNLMYTAQKSGVPFVIRYPRGNSVGLEWNDVFEELPIGSSRVLREGNDLAVLSFGHIGNSVVEAIDRASKGGCDVSADADADVDVDVVSEDCASMIGASVTHVDLRYAKPMDEQMLHWIGTRYDRVITVEDGVINGGVGSAILEFFALHGYTCHVERLGVDDKFVEHGKPAELQRLCGYDTDGIYNAIMQNLKKNNS